MKRFSSPRTAMLVLAFVSSLAVMAAFSTAPSPVIQAARADDGAVPTAGVDLFKYLQSGAYKSFSHESKVHRSQGPHGNVITYVNPILEGSLKAQNEVHPVGAAAVKELYGGNNKLTGWSVSVKTQVESEEGKGWYWYEIFSTTDGSRPLADGKGVALCTGCHAAGRDLVRIAYPLP
jgi:hypothetical protein